LCALAHRHEQECLLLSALAALKWLPGAVMAMARMQGLLVLRGGCVKTWSSIGLVAVIAAVVKTV